MDPVRFDRLAKAVAAPLPRRALLAGALAAALSRRTEAAAQVTLCCQECARTGFPHCIPDPPPSPNCQCCETPWCVAPSGLRGCCHLNQTCCPAGHCCPAEQACFGAGCRVCPSGTTKCGQDCVRACPPGFALNQRTCACDCPSGVICGLTGGQVCCSAGFACIGNRCVIPQNRPGSQTCAVGVACGSACCPRGQECSDPSTGKCCPTGTSCGHRCTGGPGVRQGQVCCNPDFSLTCNVATHVCCEGVCCNKATQSCDVNGNCVLRRRPPTRRGGT
jgi:hypothetical protein